MIAPPWPRPLGSPAFHGLAGDFVKAIAPHTEADPVALLVTFLALFGNVIERSAHFKVNDTAHRANLFAVFVGATSSGRKGTAQSAIQGQFREIDENWHCYRIQSGLSSGEGLISAVRDPLTVKKGETGNEREVTEDAGVTDKRLCVIEEEFGAVLKMCQRDGNVLSNILRLAWDGKDLSSLTKSPQRATAPHITLIGHTSQQDLDRYMNETESANGFGNRFMWYLVRRSKLLPEGGFPDEAVLKPLRARLQQAVGFGATTLELRRDELARKLWRRHYARLNPELPGMYGCLVSRGAPQVLRLSLIYALLDKSPLITCDHLRAAMELWRYSEQSVRFIFGDRIGNVVAERILKALNAAPQGLSRTEISKELQGNTKAEQIDHALLVLKQMGFAKMTRAKTTGRPLERWITTDKRTADYAGDKASG
jgi:hypothetical protein